MLPGVAYDCLAASPVDVGPGTHRHQRLAAAWQSLVNKPTRTDQQRDQTPVPRPTGNPPLRRPHAHSYTTRRDATSPGANVHYAAGSSRDYGLYRRVGGTHVGQPWTNIDLERQMSWTTHELTSRRARNPARVTHVWGSSTSTPHTAAVWCPCRWGSARCTGPGRPQRSQRCQGGCPAMALSPRFRARPERAALLLTPGSITRGG